MQYAAGRTEYVWSSTRDQSKLPGNAEVNDRGSSINGAVEQAPGHPPDVGSQIGRNWTKHGGHVRTLMDGRFFFFASTSAHASTGGHIGRLCRSGKCIGHTEGRRQSVTSHVRKGGHPD